ncbi:unnamed protein product [Boreogadus saida]
MHFTPPIMHSDLRPLQPQLPYRSSPHIGSRHEPRVFVKRLSQRASFASEESDCTMIPPLLLSGEEGMGVGLSDEWRGVKLQGRAARA